MRIAVNTRFLLKDKLEGYGYYTQEMFRRITQLHPEHEFLFLFDRPFDEQFIFGKNVTAQYIAPAARHALSFRWWYDVKLPLAIKKWKADVFVSPDGFCSLTTSIPQVLVVHDLAFLHYPKFIPKHHLFFYKRYTPKYLKKAQAVVTVSEFSKQDMINQYQLPANKITVAFSAAKPIFKPIDWTIKEAIKTQYADGKEFFLFVGGIHPRKNLMQLLKAFSIFKKWQKSSMKLLVAGRMAWQFNEVIEKLKTYKYRQDVVLLDYVDDEALAAITASAYAAVYPSYFEGFGVPNLEAMQSGVPVVTADVSSMPEVCGDAALYANPNDANAIAQQMMLLYKDENLRSRLITQGLARAQQFNWDDCAQILWQVIEQTAKS
jgi:glycosyltransferase involved in cell wall biosynthesis